MGILRDGVRLRLIEEWKLARKMWSVIFSSIGAAVMGVFTIWPESASSIWGALPEEARGALPASMISGIALFLFVMSSIARVIKQQKLEQAIKISEAKKALETSNDTTNTSL